MDRKEAKELLPIIKAFAEGKQIEVKRKNEWFGIGDEIYFSESPSDYRIKPEPKYRAFKTQEECWNEMLKHQPFGYLRYMEVNKIVQITGMETASNGELRIDLSINRHMYYTTIGLFEVYTFTDGAPFGVKEE